MFKRTGELFHTRKHVDKSFLQWASFSMIVGETRTIFEFQTRRKRHRIMREDGVAILLPDIGVNWKELWEKGQLLSMFEYIPEQNPPVERTDKWPKDFLTHELLMID